MSNKWQGPTGVITLDNNFKFQASCRSSLIELLGRHPATDQFIDELEYAIRAARGENQLRAETLPEKVRSRIISTVGISGDLIALLRQLDPASKIIISEQSGGSFSKFLAQLEKSHQILLASLDHATDQARPGRKKENYKNILAYRIAQAIQTILNVEPKTTRTTKRVPKDGELPVDLYEQVLRIAFNSAGFLISENTDLYPQLREGLHILKGKIDIDGLIILPE